MDYEEIKKILAPCGLSCLKCMAYTDGEIKYHATELKRLLGSFDIYAERFSNFLPAFSNYPSFKEVLDIFLKSECKGCRNGDCIYPNCGVAACYKEKGVDFCFQCDDFPCDLTNFDPHLHKRWLKMNQRMKEIGVEAYYEETKVQPRYVP
jgi:hypothetical protein